MAEVLNYEGGDVDRARRQFVSPARPLVSLASFLRLFQSPFLRNFLFFNVIKRDAEMLSNAVKALQEVISGSKHSF